MKNIYIVVLSLCELKNSKREIELKRQNHNKAKCNIKIKEESYSTSGQNIKITKRKRKGSE